VCMTNGAFGVWRLARRDRYIHTRHFKVPKIQHPSKTSKIDCRVESPLDGQSLRVDLPVHY